MADHFYALWRLDLHRLLEFTLGDCPLWQMTGGSSMPDNRAIPRKKMQAELAELKNSAITKLERRGYEVRGKTTAQIRKIIRQPPTFPESALGR
jgi:hypothetical protein